MTTPTTAIETSLGRMLVTVSHDCRCFYDVKFVTEAGDEFSVLSRGPELAKFDDAAQSEVIQKALAIVKIEMRNAA